MEGDADDGVAPVEEARRLAALSKERELPYDRPKLSKNMQVTAADIGLRKADFYAAHGVELRLGVTVAEVNNVLKRFDEMREMMRKMGKFQKMMSRMGGGGLMGGLPFGR